MSPQRQTSTVTDVRIWQQQIVRGVLRALVVVGFIAAAVSSYYSYTQGLLWVLPLYWLAYAIVIVVAFWKRVPYSVQVWIIIGAFYLLALVDFATEGRGASARLFLLLIPFVAALFLGQRETVFSSALALLTIVAFGWAFSTGQITDYQEVRSTDPAGWASNTFVWLMLTTLIVVSLRYLVPRLSDTLAQSRRLAGELEEQRDQLEDLVDQRTADLERRRGQLETAAEVARDAAVIQDLDRLLDETARLVSLRFGFYHTGIFLLDEEREYAVLRAASSSGGRRMLARGHRLRVGEAGIVGYVTGRGEPRIALNVGEDAVYFDNLDLPETHSEVALPLRARGEIIGALDVQSTKPEAFGQEDVTVLQTLADQLAVAIRNAHLVQQLQASLEVERRAYGQVSRQAWQGLIRSRSITEQRYDPQGLLSEGGRWRREMEESIRSGRPIAAQEGESAVLAMPLRVRDQVIGVLDAHKPRGSGDWTAEEIEFLQALVEQLGVALDSARLYQDTQRRVARERLTSEVTARMRETLDVDEVLRTAAQEMRQALGLSKMTIRLTPGADGSGEGIASNGEE